MQALAPNPPYADRHDPRLRFGDVVEGLPAAHLDFDGPSWRVELDDFHLRFGMSSGPSVILTPCCEIGNENRYLSIAPVQSPQDFSLILQNEHFREDPTRINDLVEPEKQISDEKWQALAPERRAEKQAIGPSYAFTYLFIYPSRPPIIPESTVRVKTGGARASLPAKWAAVDFRRVYRVYIPAEADFAVVARKRLQLDIPTRELLRRKLGKFFSTPPQEDLLSTSIATSSGNNQPASATE